MLTHEAPQNLSSEMKATLVELSLADLEALTSPWQQLASRDRNLAPFFQPYWFKAFARSFGGGNPVPTVLVQGADGLRGILPLMSQSRIFDHIPVNALGSLSGIHSCRFDLVCAEQDVAAVSLAAWECLRDHQRWSVLELRTVPENGACHELMKHAQQDGFSTTWWPTLLSPYLPLPVRGQDPFKNSPQKYKADRKRLRKYEGRLREFGEVSFTVLESFSEEFFADFLHLEGAGWKGQTGGAIRCSKVATQFYREILEEAARQGHLRQCALEVSGKRVAMEMAFVVDNRCFSPKIAYDEQFSRCAPGQILARAAISDLVERGITEYDLLGVRARHKSIWTSSVRPHGTVYIFKPNLRGRVSRFLVSELAARAKRFKHCVYGDPQVGS